MSAETFKAKSPTRVDLAGGTLDMWPLWSFLGGAKTINVAINIFTYAEIETRRDNKIYLESKDVGISQEFANMEDCLNDRSGQFTLYQSQLKYWWQELQGKGGFKISTRSESPVGGGLGGSSSLVISLLRVFAQFCGRRFKDVHEMVKVAHNLEAELLHTPTGTQDYYPAVTGGLSTLQYSPDGITQTLHDIDLQPIKKNFLLVHTGKAHHSGLNNFEVLKAAVARDPQTLKALHEIKAIAESMDQAVCGGKWEKLPELFKREFAARVKLCPAFTSPEIERLVGLALANGAQGAKICGAGGGGCVLIWTPEVQRQAVEAACSAADFMPLAAGPVSRNEL